MYVLQTRKTKKFYLALVRGHVATDRLDINIAVGTFPDNILIEEKRIYFVYNNKGVTYILEVNLLKNSFNIFLYIRLNTIWPIRVLYLLTKLKNA